MPNGCPNCVRVLEELVQEIRKMTTGRHIAASLAAQMEHEIQAAIAESKRDTPDLKTIVGRLEGAKTLIEGVASAEGLLANFAETTTTVQRLLP